MENYPYHISSVIRQSFPCQNNPKNSRSILYDGCRSLGLFMKGKTHIIANFLWTDLVISSHFREEETPSYTGINTVYYPFYPFLYGAVRQLAGY